MRCSTSSYLLLDSLCQQLLCQQLEHVWSFLILHYKPFPLHCLTLQICQMQAMVVDSFHFNKLWINSFWFSHLCGPHILSVFLQKPPALLILGLQPLNSGRTHGIPLCLAAHQLSNLHQHGTMETVIDLFSWAPKSLQMVTAAMKLKDTCSLEEKLWQT